tara:strand:+ start:55 stop:786 length:732 start_codon:yes stop_codon:yes gene_type:complete
MAYDYLGLVNDVCGRVNETPLTSANFSTAVGFYSTAKEAINSAIRDMNQQAFEWPFNHTNYDETLVAGTSRYAYQADTKYVDMDTLRIRKDIALGNETSWLKEMDYDEYVQNFIDAEYDATNESIRSVPRFVVRAPNQELVVYPVPDKAYTLTYEYYALPTDLSVDTDVPSAPVAFRHVIVDGAMYYTYHFRGDTETADRLQAKFLDGIQKQRTIYINSGYGYVRDTRTQRSNSYGFNRLRVT